MVPVCAACRDSPGSRRFSFHKTPSSSHGMIGQDVSHYRVLQELGAGGMGVVFRAEDTRLGRQVALKFLPVELADSAEALARFQREARARFVAESPAHLHGPRRRPARPAGPYHRHGAARRPDAVRSRSSRRPPVDRHRRWPRRPDRRRARRRPSARHHPSRRQAGQYLRHRARATRSCSTSAWPSWPGADGTTARVSSPMSMRGRWTMS